jgi:capsid assembly protease
VAISQYASLFGRIFCRPLLIEPVAAAVVLNAISDRFGVSRIVMDGNVLNAGQISEEQQTRIRARREYSVSNGVATIPIFGELANRSAYLQPESGLTGYSAIGANLDLALSDQDVRGILLDIDSPGGEVGVRDLALRIKSIESEKPIWALIDNFGASSAYYIAAAADRVIVPGEATSGSIGSIAMIPNVQKKMEKEGIEVTIVRSGQMKGKPNSFEAMDEKTMKLVADRVDSTGEEFVKTVAAFRGLPQKTVRDTEASVIFGRQMLDLRLADVSQSAHETRSEFAAYVNRGTGGRRRSTETEQAMPTRTLVNLSTGERREIEVRPGQAITMSADELLVPPGFDPGEYLAFAQGRAPVQASVPTQPAVPTVEQAVAAERQRVAAILALPEAKGREAYAMRLATSGLTGEQVSAILSEPRQDAPAEPQPRQVVESSPFHAAMSGAIGRPSVGPDVPAGGVPAGVGQIERSPFGPNPEQVQGAAAMILGAVPKELRRQ